MIRKQMAKIIASMCMLVAVVTIASPFFSVIAEADTTSVDASTTQESMTTAEAGTTAQESSTTTEAPVIVKTGLQKENGKTYYYDSKGNKVKNKIVKIKNKKYYFDKKGAMVTKKRVKIDDKKYYFNEKGVSVTKKLVKIDGKKYYFNEKGVMVTKKLVKINGKKYYFDKNGAMVTKKIVKIDGKKYYFNEKGVMVTKKLVKIDGKKYYFNDNGAMVTNKSVTIKNKKYFFDKNGVIAISRFATIKDKTYYFDENGVKQTGWMEKGGNYYYLDRSTGVQTKNGTVNGITIKKGKAVKSDYNVYKIETMMKARAIVEEHTSSTDSKAEKLKKVFEWVRDGYYKQYRILPLARQTAGWEMTFANDHFDNSDTKYRYGCCVSDACAFAFLATECGYEAYIVDDGEHAWTEIDGLVYDPLFVSRSNGYARFYGATYAKANSGKETLNPVNKTEV